MDQAQLKEALGELGVEVPESRRILVVDDVQENVEVLAALLEDTGRVFTARSGAEALKVLEVEGEVDVVVADQRMPGMTGVELLATVAEQYPDTIRMVLTGYAEVAPMIAAINQGYVFRFMLKPFDPEGMRAAVRDALEEKANTAALRLMLVQLANQSRELADTNLQLIAAEEDRVATRMDVLGRIVTSVAHDTRTELVVLTQMAQDLEQADWKDGDIEQSAERIVTATASLLDWLACLDRLVRSRDLPGRRVVVNPARLLEEAAGLLYLHPLMRERSVEIQIDPLIGDLNIDVQATQQAILALLLNGALASAAEQPIALRMRPLASSDVAIEAEDRGCGMEADTLDRATDLFYSQRDGISLGLGLSVAKMVAEAQGGSLQLDSEPGKGSVARMILANARLERSI